MRRVWIGLVVVTIVALTMVGCGSSDAGVTEVTVTTETSTTQAPAAESSTTQALSTETSVTEAPNADDWTTIATLRSTDSPWQGLDGIFVSEPFTITGEAQIVLDMPDPGELDGVIVAVIAADKATDPTALMGAIQDGVVVTLLAMAPTQPVTLLDGTYVLVNSVPETKAWSVNLQTRP
jgi:hypothetical protein